MAAPNGDQLLKMMILKRLKKEGAPAFKDTEVDGLDDIEIRPEHEELLGGLVKLFKTADKDFITLAELREFEMLLEKKGVVEEGGLLKKGGILESVEKCRREDLTEEQLAKARSFSLKDHLKPTIKKLSEESDARKKAIAMGRLVKEKEGIATKKVISSEDRARTREVRVKLKLSKGGGASGSSSGGGSASKGNGEEEEVKRKVLSKDSGTSGGDGGQRGVKESGKNGSKVKGRGGEKLASGRDILESSVDAPPTRAKEREKEEREKREREEKEREREKEKEREREKEKEREREKERQRQREKEKEREKRKEEKVPPTAPTTSSTEVVHKRVVKEGKSGEGPTTFREMLYTSEELNTRPGADGEGPPVVSYQVALKCLSRGTTEVKDLEFWEVPRTGAALKDRIERQFQIPTSFQHDLSFSGTPIEDSTLTTSISLKPRSKLELTYLCEGELEEVRVALKFYEFFLRFAHNRHASIFTGMPLEYAMLCQQGITECFAEKLSRQLFVPWNSDVKYANRVYFIQKGGIDGGWPPGAWC